MRITRTKDRWPSEVLGTSRETQHNNAVRGSGPERHNSAWHPWRRLAGAESDYDEATGPAAPGFT